MDFPQAIYYDGKAVLFSIPENKEQFNWSSQVKIKDHDSILHIYGIQREPFVMNRQIGKKTIPVCKSNLQKCIRRKDSDRAVRTALAIYSYNPNEVLRRLPIIAIEDCLPLPDAYLKLVFWMVAVSKGYIMSKDEVENMLGIVESMCESETYEVPQKADSDTFVDMSKLSEDQKHFLWALEIRKMYRGMHSDQDMIDFHKELWTKRFQEDECWWNMLCKQDEYTIEVESIEMFSKNDLLLEAFDQHCFPFIPKKIIERVENVGVDEVRLAIWMCRSRLNYRKPIDSDSFVKPSAASQAVMKKIEKELHGFTLWLRGALNLGD